MLISRIEFQRLCSERQKLENSVLRSGLIALTYEILLHITRTQLDCNTMKGKTFLLLRKDYCNDSKFNSRK